MALDPAPGPRTGGAPVPDGLAWHYPDGPGLLAILSSHTLWATAAPFLNDREEVALGGRMVVERMLEAGAAHGGVAGELADRVREATAREMQLELVDAALALLGDLAGGPAAPFARRPLDDGTEPELTPALREHLARHLEPLLDALQEALLLVKHEGFADERETRYAVMLLTRPGEASRLVEASLLSYRASAYGIAPYLRLTGTDPDRPDAPVATRPSLLPIRAVAVSLSPNGSEATASVRTLLLSHGHDVPVRRSAIPFRS